MDQRHHAMRDEIFRAAARLFVMKGFRGTTMQELADEFGFTKPALYYYIGSKEQMLIDMAAKSYRKLLRNLETATQTTDDPAKQIATVIQSHVAEATSDAAPLMVLEPTDHPDNPKFQVVVRAMSSEYARGVAAILQRGIDEGSFNPSLDTHVVSLAITGMCAWTARWFREAGRLTRDEIADQFAMVVLDSIRLV